MSESIPTIEKMQPESAPAGAPEESTDGASWKEEVRELKDRHIRLQAEFENFRKRKMRESAEIRKYAAAPVFEALVPVIDHLELALRSDHDRSDPKWAEGIDLIARQLGEVLRTAGLETIEAAKGDVFDAACHEASEKRASADVPPGHVVALVRKGYRLADRLIRPAHVVVATAESAPESGVGANAAS